ncbi:hypothetical protein ABZY68_37020, partial [Streptomyces sp. NPDC006482]
TAQGGARLASSRAPRVWSGGFTHPQEFKGLFMNISKEPVTISKGQRIMQGVFVKYLTTDDDNANGKRTGGFGSTGEV